MSGESEDDTIQAMFALDTWNKMMVIAGAAAAVAITIFLVVCCVGDGCLLHDLLTRNKRERSEMLDRCNDLTPRKEGPGTEVVRSSVRVCREDWSQSDQLQRTWSDLLQDGHCPPGHQAEQSDVHTVRAVPPLSPHLPHQAGLLLLQHVQRQDVSQLSQVTVGLERSHH